ncbi:tRNA (mnm(5)s(2)U34)-methyltransferase [Cohnella silvisoli]|uniref:Class I SAM-dependent methyltransferase n=1 Tax=Cohnella silvisoli TaxID=2873699 RepID=A0ABV1KXJ2_9BACL|nr:class I SAM-dependent methyltransferase [Cohnella silvisoli]MCD9024119.1 16S rRNA (cytosine(1402)-N(4))-methyltransferase [Cohnella silvisoli]
MGFLFVVSQAQKWVAEKVRPGDIVIDATAGNGSDTLFLARTAGTGGTVYAFDIQSEALEQTRNRLESEADGESLAPVTLVHDGHEVMKDRIASAHHGKIAAIMFNLGFLPGGSQAVITQTPTTLAALDAALPLLRSGGILTVVVYPGHEGGQAEADAVLAWASEIEPSLAQTVVYRFPQKAAAPYLIALNKR